MRYDGYKLQRKKGIIKGFTTCLTGALLVQSFAFSVPVNVHAKEEAPQLKSEFSFDKINDDTFIFNINNTEDFLTFAEKCRKNSFSKNLLVSLNGNIDLKDRDFSGIPSFSGTFLGNGYEIYNLSIEEGDEAMGLFRYLEKDGVISDLHVSGVITSSDSRDLIGGIVGVNSGTIRGCSFNGSIKGRNVVGGIAGLNGGSGRILNCENISFITSLTNIGGIVGVNRGLVSDCTNKGNVNSDSTWVDSTEKNESIEFTLINDILEDGKNIGGIAGYNVGNLTSCTNEGIVGYLKSGENVGGIAGLSSGSIFYCKNKGKIFGKQDVGGITGQLEPTIVIRGIQEIKNEVDLLYDILDESNEDLDKATNTLTNDMDKINQSADNVVNTADKLADEGVNVANRDTSVSNEVMDRGDYVALHLESVNNYMGASINDMVELNATLDKLEGEVNMNPQDKERVRVLREDINQKNNELSRLSGQASEYSGNLRDLAQQSENNPEYLRAHKEEMLRNLSELAVILSDALNVSTEIAADVNEITSIVSRYEEETSEQVRADVDHANGLSKNLIENLQGANGATGTILSYLNGQEKLELMSFSSSFTSNMDNLHTEVTDTIDAMNRLNAHLSVNSQTLEEDAKRLNAQLQVVTDLFMDRMENLENFSEGKDIVVDVSKKDPMGELCIAVVGCINEGSIDGNTNLGGIVGNISLDMLDSEDKSLGSKYELAAVVYDCTNKGFVFANNKNAGGIVGNGSVGFVHDCVSFGGILGENANYLGGIAGYFGGEIRKCNSLTVLSGNEYIGGIAGCADDCFECLSMARIINSTGRAGAILGAYETGDEDITVFHQDMEEHICENYFVSEELFGIDNVSYLGVAEPIEYRDMVKKSGDFRYLCLYFLDENNNIIKQSEYTYGADLTKIRYPKLNCDNGTYIEWQQPTEDTMLSNLVLRAQVEDNVPIIASDYQVDGKPFALAEGTFTQKARLTVHQGSQGDVSCGPISGQGDVSSVTFLGHKKRPSGSDAAYMQIHLEADNVEETDEIKLRVLTPNPKDTVIYGYMNNTWQRLDQKTIGSYTEILMTGPDLTICIVTEQAGGTFLLAQFCATGTLLVMVLLLLLTRAKRKHKNVMS